MNQPGDLDFRVVGVGPGPGHYAWPCRQDPDLWFSIRPKEVERAKRICHHCPAIDHCLASAVARGERCGVWGGQLLQDGRVVPRKRGPGRPRKHDQAA
jgi:WhiB family transcriptional regulator, redox-sensing transcriptional regulator